MYDKPKYEEWYYKIQNKTLKKIHVTLGVATRLQKIQTQDL